MRITSLSLASLSLLACRPVAPAASPVVAESPAVPSDASAEAPPPGAELPVFMVEQHVLTEVPLGFDPSGRIRLDSNCEAWNQYGHFVGTVPEDECLEWEGNERRRSPQGNRIAITDGSSVRLEGFEMSGALACDGCKNVDDVAWSPEGDRLAVVRHESKTVEIWSVTSRRRLSTLALTPDGDLVRLALAWPGALYVLESTVDDRPSCDDMDPDEVDWDFCINEWEEEGYIGAPEDYVVVEYADLESPPTRTPIGTSDWYQYLAAATLDPLGRCVYVTEFNVSMRDDLESQVTARPLAGECPIDEGAHEYDGDGWRSTTAKWSEGPLPRFMATTSTADDEFTEGLELAFYEIRITELGAPTRTWTQEYEEVEVPLPYTDKAWVEMTERELLVARGLGEGTAGRSEDEDEGEGEDVIASAWHECFELVTNADRGKTKKREWCTSSLDLPRRCEFRDLSPRGEGVLARCGRRDGSLTFLMDGERHDLKIAGDAEWAWGETWLATIDDVSGVTLRTLAAPKRSSRLGSARAWVDTTLGPSLDLIVLEDAGQVRIFDALSGEVRSSVKTELDAVRHAALSPSEQRLALTDGSTIETFDLTTEARLGSWAANHTRYLAWRQDGAVVFSGPDPSVPTAAWDGRDGSPRADALPEGLYPDTLDPSWRWSLVTPNRVKRMVDGLEIWFDESGVLLDDGRFEGDPAALSGVMYRLGEDFFDSPMVESQRMRAVMHRDGLAEDFFAGRPIDMSPIRVRMADLLPAEEKEPETSEETP